MPQGHAERLLRHLQMSGGAAQTVGNQPPDEPVPPFLCVVDSVKAALMKTEVALPLPKDKTRNIKWGKSASDVTRDRRRGHDGGLCPLNGTLYNLGNTDGYRRFPSFDYSIREKLRLNRPDVGWYQIRQALKLTVSPPKVTRPISRYLTPPIVFSPTSCGRRCTNTAS